MSSSKLIEAFGNDVIHFSASFDCGNSYSFSKLLKLGQELVNHDFDHKSLVVAGVSNSKNSIASYMYLLNAGHVIVLTSGKNRNKNLEIAGRLNANAILLPDETSSGERLTILHNEKLNLNPELSILLPTSGSTGASKFARFTLKNFSENAISISSYLGLDKKSNALSILPIYYSFGLSILHSHLVVGGRVNFCEHPLISKEFRKRAMESNSTSFSGIPFHYEMITRFGFDKLGLFKIKVFLQAGGKLPANLVTKLATDCEKQDKRFIVMYGQTEAGPRIAYLPHFLAKQHPNTVGIPIPGVRCWIEDDLGNIIQKPDTPGILKIESPAVMQGYCLEQADLSRGDDQRGFFNTGDIAKWDENHLLEIIGRADRMVKVGGIRVELDHLEFKLKELNLPIWHVVGRENFIYVLVHIGVCQNEIAQALKEIVDIPSPYIHILEFDIDDIPRTENGKVALKKTLEICDKIFGEA